MKKSIGAKTIAYPHPVFVIGSYDASGRANIMTASWGGICCSSPPCLAVSLRKATLTYHNLVDKRAFTVNFPPVSAVREADYVGIYSGHDTDKFADLNLTPVRSETVDAPYVSEWSMVLECKVLHILDLGLHTQFVAEIVDVKADEKILLTNGLPDICAVDPLVFGSGNQAYYSVGPFVAQAFSVGMK